MMVILDDIFVRMGKVLIHFWRWGYFLWTAMPAHLCSFSVSSPLFLTLANSGCFIRC